MKLFELFGSLRDRASRIPKKNMRNSESASYGGWVRVRRQVLGVALMVGASASYADCHIAPGWTNSPTFVALSGSYNVSPSAPNGMVIATFYAATIPQGTNTAGCDPNTVDAIARAVTVQPRPAVNLAQAVFESGVPGIGIQLRDGTGTKIPPWQSAQTSCVNGGGCGNAFAVVASNPQFQVSFIKTGPVGSGSVNATDIPQITARILTSGVPLYYLAAMGSVNFTVPGCKVSAPTVALGTHGVAEFTGTGYTTRPIDFNVILSNCPTAGVIFYQLDSVNGYESLAQSILKLQGGTGSASGIGVQILNATSLVPFPMGSPQSLTTGPSNFTLPFKARYYQTAGTVTTGIANAAMGVTLTYN